MYCAKCGSELEENAAFCPNCGASATETEGSPLKKLLGNKKLLLILAAAVAAVVLLCVLLNGSGINSSPEKLAAAVVESEYGVDIDKMVKCFPKFTLRELASDYDLKNADDLRGIKEGLKQDYRHISPEEVKILSTTVTETHSPGAYLYSYTYAYYEYDHLTNEEYNAIEQVAEVEVRYTRNGSEHTSEVVCIEMNGKWYLLR